MHVFIVLEFMISKHPHLSACHFLIIFLIIENNVLPNNIVLKHNLLKGIHCYILIKNYK